MKIKQLNWLKNMTLIRSTSNSDNVKENSNKIGEDERIFSAQKKFKVIF